MDYTTRIDAETWAFIRETEAFYPPDAINMPISEQRQIYDDLCRAFFQGYPDGVAAHDRRANGVPVRVYECGNPAATVLYFHGGGYVVGGLDSHDDICAEICARTGFRVVSADYRLSPEHKHPAAFDDAWAVAQNVCLAWPESVILAGDSAGGNLAAAVAHYGRGKLDFAGQVLIYPGLDSRCNQGSYLTHAQAPMLTREDTLFYKRIRAAGSVPSGDPTFAPLDDTDFSGLPPTIIVSAECDPLSDDGRHYRDRIVAAGGQAAWVNEAGLVHGYLRARNTVTRARQSFDRIVSAISELGQTPRSALPPDPGLD